MQDTRGERPRQPDSLCPPTVSHQAVAATIGTRRRVPIGYTCRIAATCALAQAIRPEPDYLHADAYAADQAHNRTESALGVALPGYSCSRCVIGPGLGLGAQSRRSARLGGRPAWPRGPYRTGCSVAPTACWPVTALPLRLTVPAHEQWLWPAVVRTTP